MTAPENHRQVKIILINEDKTYILKIWEHLDEDVDFDGTLYYRGLTMKKCGCEKPFRLKMIDFDSFCETQVMGGFTELI